MYKLQSKRASQLLLGTIFLFGIANSAQAAEEIQPKAQQILDRSLNAYRSLQSYQDTAMKSSIAPAGKQTARQLISWKAPRYLNVVTMSGKNRLVDNYDGRNYNFTNIDRDKKLFWSTEPLPETSYGRHVLLQYQPTGLLFTPFLAGVNPFEEPFGIPMASVTLKNATTLDGVKVDTIVATPKGDPKTHFTYLIGQKDHLVRRISMESLTVAGDKYSMSETHTNIKTNVKFAPGTFTFRAPANTPLKHPMTDAVGETFKAGDTPPPINAKDINGLSASIAQHKGKVLLVDFWASWCGPCVQAMPYLKSYYQKYHSQGFDILGISSDATIGDLKKFIKDESIPWQQVYDPEGKAGEPYNVQYIPFSVLIGRDGKVIAVNKDRLLLDTAIRKALKE